MSYKRSENPWDDYEPEDYESEDYERESPMSSRASGSRSPTRGQTRHPPPSILTIAQQQNQLERSRRSSAASTTRNPPLTEVDVMNALHQGRTAILDRALREEVGDSIEEILESFKTMEGVLPLATINWIARHFNVPFIGELIMRLPERTSLKDLVDLGSDSSVIENNGQGAVLVRVLSYIDRVDLTNLDNWARNGKAASPLRYLRHGGVVRRENLPRNMMAVGAGRPRINIPRYTISAEERKLKPVFSIEAASGHPYLYQVASRMPQISSTTHFEGKEEEYVRESAELEDDLATLAWFLAEFVKYHGWKEVAILLSEAEPKFLTLNILKAIVETYYEM